MEEYYNLNEPFEKCGILKDVETVTDCKTKILDDYKDYSITANDDDTKLENDVYRISRPHRIRRRIRIIN